MTKLGLGFRPPVRLFPFAVGLIAAIAGIVVLAGWALDVRALESVVPGFATMKVNTSLGIMLLGLALALMQCGAAARRLGKAAAGIAIIIGVITLIEYALDLDAGIDQLLFTDSQTLAIYHPGRPSHATAFNLMILGIGLLCVDSRACRCLTTALAMIASLVSWVALNGYLFGAPALYGVGLYSSIALHTAALFFLYSLGLFAAQPQCSPTKIVLSKGIGGTLSRWLLPFAVLAPPALGWAFRHGQALGIYHGEFSWALYSVASSVGSVALILLLAHRIAALDAERSKATELSRRDPLTGLPNRRAFDAFLLESFRLARRHVRPLSLLMLDVDHFKEYNDSFGHPSGDEALQTAAHLLGRHARETDLVARIGGEEFAIVLPETDLAGALLMGERIRDEVERSMLFRSPMTVSIGAASLAEGVEDTAQFVKECDTALYLAKQRGRNRVSWIGEPMSDNEPGIGIQA